MPNWKVAVAAAFDAVAGRRGRPEKVRSTPFEERNGTAPFNASGVTQVGADRFVFIDNHDPTALFELTVGPNG
ncbi:MAG: hypothetical protein ABW001_09100 [Mycobacterium sp.]